MHSVARRDSCCIPYVSRNETSGMQQPGDEPPSCGAHTVADNPCRARPIPGRRTEAAQRAAQHAHLDPRHRGMARHVDSIAKPLAGTCGTECSMPVP